MQRSGDSEQGGAVAIAKAMSDTPATPTDFAATRRRLVPAFAGMTEGGNIGSANRDAHPFHAKGPYSRAVTFFAPGLFMSHIRSPLISRNQRVRYANGLVCARAFAAVR